MTKSLLVGSQRPAICHLPEGVETSVGADLVELAATAGLELDDWQAWTLIQSMRERPDGLWAAFEAAVWVGRQNGKGGLLEARQLGGLFYLREPLQVHTSHEFKTTFEHFLRMVNLIEGCPDLDRKVQRVRRGAGEQAIELKTGERLRFLARSSGSGRGFTGDVVYLDEAYALTMAMMGALIPTLSAVPNPQIFYTSSAARESSEVQHDVSKRALDGSSPRLFYADWRADPDDDPRSMETVAKANPALGIRISEDFIRAEMDAMSPAEFARERLGIPEEPPHNASGPIPPERWEQLLDARSRVEADEPSIRLALDVSPDRCWATFAVAAIRPDGLAHVEVRDALDLRSVPAKQVVARGGELSEGHSTPVVIVKGSPAESFVADLEADATEVDVMSNPEFAAACGRFIDACAGVAPTVRHLGQPQVRAALAAARLKDAGDGAHVWSRRGSTTDISPLTAITAAFGRIPQPSEPEAPAFVSRVLGG